MKCRICKSATSQHGYLYRCLNVLCSSVFWDKGQVKRSLRRNPEALSQVLEDAEVPKPLKQKNSKFVYVLRLKGEKNAVYVGMTGLHPYERYLNHIRGHRASGHAKKRATALITFEGPLTACEAERREPELAEELRLKGRIVYGGH